MPGSDPVMPRAGGAGLAGAGLDALDRRPDLGDGEEALDGGRRRFQVAAVGDPLEPGELRPERAEAVGELVAVLLDLLGRLGVPDIFDRRLHLVTDPPELLREGLLGRGRLRQGLDPVEQRPDLGGLLLDVPAVPAAAAVPPAAPRADENEEARQNRQVVGPRQRHVRRTVTPYAGRHNGAAGPASGGRATNPRPASDRRSGSCRPRAPRTCAGPRRGSCRSSATSTPATTRSCAGTGRSSRPRSSGTGTSRGATEEPRQESTRPTRT